MKILVVLPRFPFPLEKGDKLRAYHQVRTLSAHHDVYLFCVSHSKVTEEQMEALRPYCKEMKVVKSPRLTNLKNVVRNYLRTKSLQLGYWDSRRARKACKQFVQQVGPDVIYNQMVRTMPLVARIPLPKVMDFQDALSMNVERRMEKARGLWHYILHFEFKMLRSTEYNAFKIFDALTIISEPDSEAIPHNKNGEIRIIRNGVDFDFFHPIEAPKKYEVVFCGNMGYDPNIKAAQFLVNQVMPIVWREYPNARVLLAGTTPKTAVRKLASPLVTVSGWVKDIRQCYAQARIFAAPMQTGSGLQNKLLEAMAMQLPCVTTSIANVPLGAEAGRQVLVGDDPQQVAQSILDLLHDESLCQRLRQEGSQFVHDHFSWESAGEQLEAVLAEAARQHL